MEIGTIKQFKGPFSANSTVDLPSFENHCKIGISIGLKDFMSLGSTANTSLRFYIRTLKDGNITQNLIHMGRTCMYLTDEQINNLSIVFPDGAPSSTIVLVVYMEKGD